MSLIAEALQPSIVRQLALLAGRAPVMTLPGVITAPAVGYDLLFDDTDESITMDFMDSRVIVAALAADYCRFCSASFQTISQVPAEIVERDRVAWSLIKAYYSAFYAGHALIRMFGEACSFFDREQTARLIELGTALGRERAFNIERGMYQCVFNPGATAIRCRRARGAAGGAHEAFWGIFGVRVQALSESVLRGGLVAADAQQVFARIDLLIEILRRRVDFSWLSAVRNEIQYRHHHSVWFPERLRMTDRRSLGRLAGEWQRDPMEIDLNIKHQGVLAEYISSCVFIVALCHAMLMWLAERSAAGARSFVHPGPMTFLNDIRARPV
jgi:hypothetical protein